MESKRARERAEGVRDRMEHEALWRQPGGKAGVRVKEVGRLARAWRPCPEHKAPIGAFYRARGGQRRA